MEEFNRGIYDYVIATDEVRSQPGVCQRKEGGEGGAGERGTESTGSAEESTSRESRMW